VVRLFSGIPLNWLPCSNRKRRSSIDLSLNESGEDSMAGEKGRDTVSQAGLEQGTARAKKRPARKIAKVVASKKFKVTYYLSDEAIQRVGIAATMEHADKSEIVERLIQQHLRQWVVSFRGERREETDAESGRAGESSLAG
jgi:hypothetical protein